MIKTKLGIFILTSLTSLSQCKTQNKEIQTERKKIKSEVIIENQVSKLEKQNKQGKNIVVLNDDNAIPFFHKYEKENPENKIRISTRFGDIDIKLYKNTPYHRANFIYLTKKKYFNGTTFHRVVPDFVIQGGNSDRNETAKKRRLIGKYLLPPDTRKGFKHHRGAISMPSSEIENPHKLASPFEFFIVKQSPGAYHLDGSYTVFGKVINGMNIVDEINKQKIDNRDMPLTNIHMEISIIE
tara:strand:+ start:614 stop:1333 length:720 start_codon:yes stop_codon:yes gene_type:complete